MLILFNGHVHTNQPGVSPVSALAIDHGLIIAAGSDDEIINQFGARAERTDLDGRTVWPGLIDAHIHLEYYSLSLAQVNCETATRGECLK